MEAFKNLLLGSILSYSLLAEPTEDEVTVLNGILIGLNCEATSCFLSRLTRLLLLTFIFSWAGLKRFLGLAMYLIALPFDREVTLCFGWRNFGDLCVSSV